MGLFQLQELGNKKALHQAVQGKGLCREGDSNPRRSHLKPLKNKKFKKRGAA